MGEDLSPSLDEKAKRTRDLLTSFYGGDSAPSHATTRIDTFHSIDTPDFDPQRYMNALIGRTNVEGLLQRHVEMAAEIKNLDSDLQMLVYENYNKFISATDTIRRMKINVVGMETNMEQLLEKITSVQSKSDGINASLFERRECIEKLNRTRSLLHKLQFIYDLPARLTKCIKSEAYADAVKYYVGALPVFKAYGQSSFEACRKESEEAIGTVIRHLQARLLSDCEPVEARAEAVVLLKQLGFPVDNLKTEVLEAKLEHFLSELQAEARQQTPGLLETEKSSENMLDSTGSKQSMEFSKKDSIGEFAKTVTAYRIIFPNSEKRLTEVAIDLFNKLFASLQNHEEGVVSATKRISSLRVISSDVRRMDEVLPEACLPDYAIKAAETAIKQHVSDMFGQLYSQLTGDMVALQSQQKERGSSDEMKPLQMALDSGKDVLFQGSMDVLWDFRQLLDDNLDILVKLRDAYIDWVQGGFQDFFRSLKNFYISFSKGTVSNDGKPPLVEKPQADKVSTGVVLVMAQLSVFIEQTVVPKITEEIATSFSGGGARSYEEGPPFVPAEICRMFRSTGGSLMHLYINMQARKLSLLVKKSIATPNWLKYKEPRDVRMFVDLLLEELKTMEVEVQQVLVRGSTQKHRRSDSTGSTNSSRSNRIRDDRSSRLSTQRARNRLLESHVAKLFKQKVEIFTKLEYTQESVISTIGKMCLKSFQEYVRLETFSRSGFQQIQLDTQFLRDPLKEVVEDEAIIDFLLDEVCAAAAERCLDPIPLEPAILDKLIYAKITKNSEQTASS
uniref:Vacuolar protein sorting-associated protein 51 homolog n=1 Tax=Cupressus gigantea TaxID=329084 RepID=A0A3S6N0B9_9CONI|nr:VPS51 unhinged vacuolar protein sorting 51 [Cupressus gigantea]